MKFCGIWAAVAVLSARNARAAGQDFALIESTQPAASPALGSLHTPPQTQEQHPGLEIAVRQQLLDYGSSVGLEILTDHIHTLVFPNVTHATSVPVLGPIEVSVMNLSVDAFTAAAHAARIEIEDGHFRMAVADVSARLSFAWAWRSLNAAWLGGRGEGAVAFQQGSLHARFKLHDEGRLILVMDQPASSIAFADITVSVSKALLKPVYSAALRIFHEQIAARVGAQMNQVLRQSAPKALNALLASVPSQVVINGLPFSAAFQYALYTHGFVMVTGNPRFTPESAAACPHKAPKFPVSDRDVLADEHMVSGYVSDAVLRCMLWALHEQGLLRTEIRDGDLPNVRLITDLLPYLLPGIQKEFPHQSVGFRVAASAAPETTFSADSGMATTLEFDLVVFVLPKDSKRAAAEAVQDSAAQGGQQVGQAAPWATAAAWLQARAEGAPGAHDAGSERVAAAPQPQPDEAVEVARLHGSVAADVRVGFAKSHLAGLKTTFSVAKARYPVDPAHWETTTAFVLRTAASQWGLRELYRTFAPGNVSAMFRPKNVEGRYLDGWYAVSTDVEADAA